MGACIDAPRDKKSKPKNKTIPKVEQPKKTPLEKSQLFRSNLLHSRQQDQPHSPAKPKYKSMSIDQLLLTYRNQGTLDLSSKLEGPKYLSNLVDGSSKILRIFNMEDIKESRLDAYRQLLGFEVFQNDEGSHMILDQYCCGEDLYELTDKFKQAKSQDMQSQLLDFLKAVFKIVSQFHGRGVWLGNLNLSSFRRVSPFERQVRLVDFNLAGGVSEHQKMGFAHKENYEADYQFLGYLVQFLVSDQAPIFIPHKVQYSEFDVIPYSALIQNFLKGKKCSESELNQIQAKNIIINERVSLGYRFRRDVNKLLKMRKKRKAHNRKFYGEDTQVMIGDGKFNEDGLYRLEADRIFDRIGSYIYRVRNTQEEPFLNYSGGNEVLRRLKQIFLLTDGEKKLTQLKECMSTIK